MLRIKLSGTGRCAIYNRFKNGVEVQFDDEIFSGWLCWQHLQDEVMKRPSGHSHGGYRRRPVAEEAQRLNTSFQCSCEICSGMIETESDSETVWESNSKTMYQSVSNSH